MKSIILILGFIFSGIVYGQPFSEKELLKGTELSAFFKNNFNYKEALNYRCNGFIVDIFFIEFEIDNKGRVQNEHIDKIALPHLRPIFLHLLKTTDGKWNERFQRKTKNKIISIPIYYSYEACNRDTSALRDSSETKTDFKISCCEAMNLFSKEVLSIKKSLQKIYSLESINIPKKKPYLYLPLIFIEDNPAYKGFTM